MRHLRRNWGNRVRIAHSRSPERYGTAIKPALEGELHREAGLDISKAPKGERAMTGMIEQKLAALGITLPAARAPVANYVPFVRSGNLLTISGQVCYAPDGSLIAKGKLGATLSIDQGVAAARGCAINLLAQLRAATGDLDKVVRVVRLGGFINSAPDFLDGPKVMNGASDLMVEVFGDIGRHARSAMGVYRLPMNFAVEVDAVVSVS